MKQRILFITVVLTAKIILYTNLTAQGIAIGGSEITAHDSAILEVHSTEKGVLIPQMTKAQKEAIASPAEGLVVYQTDVPEGIKYFDGNVWVDTETFSGTLASGSGSSTGVSINSTGAAADPSAMLDISSTTQGFLPPRMTLAQRTAISSPAQGLMVYQTDGTKGLYCYDGSGWNILYNNNHYVGESYGGGIVVYVDSTGMHGVIFPEVDVVGDYGVFYWDEQETFTGASRKEIGKGYHNTVEIINTPGVDLETLSGPKACVDWVHNGYSDWYLPSIDELQLLYDNKDLFGNITEVYWSSTEVELQPSTAYIFYFGYGYSGWMDKLDAAKVRAVRYF